ncbi:hypothetical protein MJO28_015903 [Puccinia striiformis f. sp. tritici]|uniref:Myb-like domain-containing protein n=2 Tax=Puccinia striiformis f. sp. tritici TaxID=168172 RepID=A0A0L0UTZ9_9BASI|nr:hypothetical protein Pst134EA_029058 [Puccinia striiformis f. sp. tritici]KAI9617193.1 hypothetical protein H4Q26_013058 [Puccinia striiformis f. sp. tritici PST-130]KNE90495.1 hypothetical protein PSTG_16059 [Puccinia striiformis f. sp. tritici PST-78]KAH9441117.1 hypothetical protein Pst134EB_029765 [Puccinia striiformis f. sp. tritici]KAH9447073.1 hypothetical protein Pst134EA_029058 [Puccinia striiformis f. sp. tritici]KAI7937004.1 hypothetical protein MJO28_015903 [Puccinia striiformis
MARTRAPTPTPQQKRTSKPRKEQKKWDVDVEDIILLEVMMLPEQKLPERDPLAPRRNKYPRNYWVRVYNECLDRGIEGRTIENIRQRWRNQIEPRISNGGYRPQFYKGDWLTLLKKLLEKGFEGSPLFPWRCAEFNGFDSLYLRGRWDYYYKKSTNREDNQSIKQFIKKEIEEYQQKSLTELNLPWRKSLGGKRAHGIIAFVEGRRNKFLPRGFNDPVRYTAENIK